MTTRPAWLALILFVACKDEPVTDDSLPADDSGPVEEVDADGDGVAADEDCDDNDAGVYPGAVELCDGRDNNCDGSIDEGVTTTFYPDGDDDGYGRDEDAVEACEAPEGHVDMGGDCDDADPSFHPGAPEEDCADPNDYNCDGSVGFADNDGDGWAACEECDDGDVGVNPDAVEVCDEIDNNCDGSIDEGVTNTYFADADGDGYGDPEAAQEACEAPEGHVEDDTDCDDGAVAVNPDAQEVCNGVDDDCDALTDDDDDSLDASTGSAFYSDTDRDGYGDPGAMLMACTQPSGAVADASDCDDADAAINPAAQEVCNGDDDDCDGLTDDDDASLDASTGSVFYSDTDRDGYGDAGAMVMACTRPSGAVADASDCDDADASTYPGAAELCDGLDNDCDNQDDEGVLGTGASCPATDCAEILADNPSATTGSYVLNAGTYTCDMDTDGGGWTEVGSAVAVWGTSYDTNYYNAEGFTWDEVLFQYDSGSVHAHCTYPGSLTGCNNLGFQFASESWGVPLNWGSSICGMSTTSYTSATSYIGGYDFVVSRASSTDTIRVGTLEAISQCTIGDNPGTAYLNILVRR